MFNDRVTEGEAKSRPSPDRRSRVERIKNLIDLWFSDAFAVVGNLNQGLIALPAQTDLQVAPIRHSVDRIEEKIHEYLLQEADNTADRDGFLGKLGDYFYFLNFGLIGYKGQGLFDQCCQVHRRRLGLGRWSRKS